MCGPTVAVWGTDEQKQRYLRPLFTGEEIWCQLFSEPGSGSDFAGLSARGVRDGDEWIVNGQKVWTTLAHVSRWGLLVVRTDPEAVKHAGLTAFVVDMQAPGVEVRAAAPDHRRGRVQRGVLHRRARSPTRRCSASRVTAGGCRSTTLMNERVSIGGRIPPRGSGAIAALLEVWQGPAARAPGRGDARRGDEAVDREPRCCASPTSAPTPHRKMGDPGPEGSIGKVALGRAEQGHLRQGHRPARAPRACCTAATRCSGPRSAMVDQTLQKAFLRSRANSIEGGTTEVMKNILGERVARPARRRPRRPRRPLERGPPQLARRRPEAFTAPEAFRPGGGAAEPRMSPKPRVVRGPWSGRRGRHWR